MRLCGGVRITNLVKIIVKDLGDFKTYLILGKETLWWSEDA